MKKQKKKKLKELLGKEKLSKNFLNSFNKFASVNLIINFGMFCGFNFFSEKKKKKKKEKKKEKEQIF